MSSLPAEFAYPESPPAERRAIFAALERKGAVGCRPGRSTTPTI